MTDCNSELDRLLDKQKAYLVTPYYKTIPEIEISGPTFGPSYNYSDYDKFCLTTNLQPIFSSLKLTFDLMSLNLNDKMVLCVIPKFNSSYFQMSEKTQNLLQKEVDFVCHNLYHLSLVYDVADETRYPRSWLYHIFGSLEIEGSGNPSFMDGKIYLSLDENIDYIENYTKIYDNLMIQISQLYNTGAIICTSEFAKNWNLDYYRNGIYLSNWVDTRITQDKSQFLYQIMTLGTYLINIPNNILTRHYLAKKYDNLVIDDQNVRVGVINLSMILEILDIISETINYEKEYNIVELQLVTYQKYLDYKNVISGTFRSSEITFYQIPNHKTPIMASILVPGKFDNLSLKINKLLNLK